MPDAVLVATARSPIGRAFKGSLTSMRPDDLAVQMLQAALAQVPELDPRDIDDLVLGCAQPGGEAGFNMARVVAVLAGMDHLPGTTVNRFCASSLQAVRMAFHAIKAGEGDAFVAAGVEAVSRFVKGNADSHPDTENPAVRRGQGADRAAVSGELAWADPRSGGELPDMYLAMGETAENVAELEGISRPEQDAFAVRSQNRAEKALADGFWERDITPVTLPDGTVVSRDDSPRAGVTLEAVAALKPAFRPNGTVTAGNACPLNDGAAAVVVMSDRKAARPRPHPAGPHRQHRRVRAVAGDHGTGAGGGLAARARPGGLSVADIDLVEMNEAFAAQVIPSARRLGIDEDRLNVHGGAIAVGHPFGMTGARIATTLLHALQERDGQFGLETMCVGGGQGMAMVLERLS